jgi:hypothetical protein
LFGRPPGHPDSIYMTNTELLEIAARLPKFVDVRLSDLSGGGVSVLFPSLSPHVEAECPPEPPVVADPDGTRFTRGSEQAE